MNTKELEKRCNELFFQVNEKTERIAELEKENAELKETVLQFQKDSYCGVCHFKTKTQLTKAKELLKEFVHHYKSKTIYIENMQDLLEQAEQFLSEV